MQSIEDLVPKNKLDFSSMEELKKLSDEEIEPIMMELLEWTRDMNWPVADEIAVIASNFVISGVLPLFEEDNVVAKEFL